MQRREATFYNASQIEKLLSFITSDSLFSVLIKITALYGLRRSEVLGLKWTNIDFMNDTIKICHTVVKVNKTVYKDKTKNASSNRIYPLMQEIKRLLIIEKAKQERNRQEFGNAYLDSQYIFVWDNGIPYSPDYVSHHFKKIIKRNKLQELRFHDLRHSCASILLSSGYGLKDVQEWLGHSDIKMTANIYGHLDIERKKIIANAMEAIIT